MAELEVLHEWTARNLAQKEVLHEYRIADRGGGPICERRTREGWSLESRSGLLCDELARLAADRKRLEEQVRELREALVATVAVVRIWHDDGDETLSPALRGKAWNIYFEKSPEMSPARAALEARDD